MSNCRRFQINLDDPPQDRWKHILPYYQDKVTLCLELIDTLVGKGLLNSVATAVFAKANSSGKIFYNAEIEGIAHQTGVPVGRIVMLQLAYEFFAACTSVVVNVDGLPFHIRTMDWEMPQLNAVTIEVEFMRQGQVQFVGTTWVGYVGVLTGMKPNAFSVSINYRRTLKGSRQGVFRNVLTNLAAGMQNSWPVSFLVREVLDSEFNYTAAVHAFVATELMAPTYITVAGTTAGEGTVITRDRQLNPALPVWHLGQHGPVVQANMDHFSDELWQNIADSQLRRNTALKFLQYYGDAITQSQLWEFMQSKPCLAADTIYTVAMQAATGYYVTFVQ